MKQSKEESIGLPKWLRYLLVAALLFWLISLPFKKQAPSNPNYFPTHKPPTP